ncbi:peptide-methionine (S)-S-oxide reductase [Sphingomonas hankookensis]|uniref:peptide-methionine (S)-S-oxide reductase n=1 Tax=Sphingomonas hankookensis TaxID=563996 RepID=UPI001F5785A3|nr:peptide-methionine (S)-S-oxide reductase [Sphingomonas hankookensis]
MGTRYSMRMMEVGFGGGCHWCTEGVFQILLGVDSVDQGFLQSDPPWASWAEGVIVRFDHNVIPLDTLIEIHLRTHSANSGYSPAGRYRSAVYVRDDVQQALAVAAIARLTDTIDTAGRTRVLSLAGFRPSEERYRNYYRTDPDRPFCRRYIDPKLAAIRRDFAAIALPDGG